MPPFRATFRGRDIFSIPVPRSGAQYGALYEVMEAARWRGLTDAQFDALDADSQARIVAHFRVHHQLEAVIAQAQQREAEARQKRKAGSSGTSPSRR